jgi:hypothetical protein
MRFYNINKLGFRRKKKLTLVEQKKKKKWRFANCVFLRKQQKYIKKKKQGRADPSAAQFREISLQKRQIRRKDREKRRQNREKWRKNREKWRENGRISVWPRRKPRFSDADI